MTYDLEDTIGAIATAPGGAARGIIRISGPKAVEAAANLFEASDGDRLADVRRTTAMTGAVSIDTLAGPVPTTLYIWPTQRSYTREPVVELHTVGSPPVLEALLEAICSTGVRPAEPGEFTLRAFLAGRLDLTRAEAVLGVIDADSRDQLDQALGQLAGGIAGPITAVRETLINLLAELEAGLDFVEEDIEFITADTMRQQLNAALDAVAATAEQMAARGDSHDVLRVALVGPPNAGKSSLFNALAADSAGSDSPALVSVRPGTTRDYLTARVELDGLTCELVDTAGQDSARDRSAPASEATGDLIAAAERMTSQAKKMAAVQLVCVDLSSAHDATPHAVIDPHTRSSADHSVEQIVVGTKSDLATEADQRAFCAAAPAAIMTSSHAGQGLDALRQAIHQTISNRESHDGVAGTAVRCHESLRLAAESLRRARDIVADTCGEELVAAEVRTALTELGKVVGAVYTDDILDRIFSRFCIGK